MRSLRWKILLVTFFAVYIPIYSLNHYVIESFDRFTRKAQEETMIGYARLVAAQYHMVQLGTRERAMTPQFAEHVKDCGEQLEVRMSVLDPRGRVLTDSAGEWPPGTPLKDKVEIARAIDGRYGANWKLVKPENQVYYYVALPVLEKGEVRAVVYVIQNTGQIFKAIMRIKADQQLTMILALVGALMLAAIVAQTLTRRLRRLTRAARDHADRGAPLDVDIGGHDEIRALGDAMRNMAIQLEQRNAYHREFIATTTHELRTPLTAIRGAVEVLQDEESVSPARQSKFLDNIRYEVHRMDRMVSELHELTKLDTDLPRAARERIDYVRCVREIVERIQPALPPPHAAIALDLPDEPIGVQAVPSRLEQVFANLLSNAVRFTPPEGEIRIRVYRANDQAVVTVVEDSGSGIAPSNLAKLFNRFFTTDSAGKPGTGEGTGLGLAIVKTIINHHGGDIRAENRPSGGARFVFQLPTSYPYGRVRPEADKRRNLVA